MSKFSTVIVYVIAAALALAGIADATYLTVMHLTGQTSICGGAVGCSQVLMSKYAQIGPAPVAALGVLGYFSVFSFATFAAFGSHHARVLLVISVAAMFLGTLWLLYVQAFLLHAFCPYCLFSAALSFFLAGITLAAPFPFPGRQMR